MLKQNSKQTVFAVWLALTGIAYAAQDVTKKSDTAKNLEINGFAFKEGMKSRGWDRTTNKEWQTYIAYFGDNREVKVECFHTGSCWIFIKESKENPFYSSTGSNPEWFDQIKELVEKYEKSKASK